MKENKDSPAATASTSETPAFEKERHFKLKTRVKFVILLIFVLAVSFGGVLLLSKREKNGIRNSPISNSNASDIEAGEHEDGEQLDYRNRTHAPTPTPAVEPSLTTSDSGSNATQVNATTSPDDVQIATFYAIGDVPYTERQHEELKQQIIDLPLDAEFLIHIGDIRFGRKTSDCTEDEYSSVAETLRLSKVPVFIIIGDNDWGDCPNDDEAYSFWQKEFNQFYYRYWPNNPFNVFNQPDYPENFAFVHKRTLFVGLNIVGGSSRNKDEWNNRLSSEVQWTISLIEQLVYNPALTIDTQSATQVVIFGHADPRSSHGPFFEPLVDFIENDLLNSVPILYVNGDRHKWYHEPNYYDQPSFLRIMLAGQTKDPPLQIQIPSNWQNVSTEDTFLYDRMLPTQRHESDNDYDEFAENDDEIAQPRSGVEEDGDDVENGDAGDEQNGGREKDGAPEGKDDSPEEEKDDQGNEKDDTPDEEDDGVDEKDNALDGEHDKGDEKDDNRDEEDKDDHRDEKDDEKDRK